MPRKNIIWVDFMVLKTTKRLISGTGKRQKASDILYCLIVMHGQWIARKHSV